MSKGEQTTRSPALLGLLTTFDSLLFTAVEPVLVLAGGC